MANLELIDQFFENSGRTNQEIADIIDKPISLVEEYRCGTKPRGSSMAHLAYALKVDMFILSEAYSD